MEQDIWHPVRGSAHLFTDDFPVNSGITFDDQFIMDVSDDEAVPEGLHSIAEDVAADGLDDILHELRSVGFDAFPLLSRAYTFIGDGFSTELVCADPRLHICKPASRRKLYEEHSTFVKELDTANFSLDSLSNSRFDSAVNILPECCNHRIRVTPGIYKRLQVFFRESHIKGTH